MSIKIMLGIFCLFRIVWFAKVTVYRPTTSSIVPLWQEHNEQQLGFITPPYCRILNELMQSLLKLGKRVEIWVCHVTSRCINFVCKALESLNYDNQITANSYVHIFHQWLKSYPRPEFRGFEYLILELPISTHGKLCSKNSYKNF